PQFRILSWLKSEEPRRRDTHNGERHVVKVDGLPGNRWICTKPPLPKTVTDDGDGLRIPRPIVLGRNCSTKHPWHTQHGKEVAGHGLGADELHFCVAAVRNNQPVLESHATGSEEAGEGTSALAELLVEGIRERIIGSG